MNDVLEDEVERQRLLECWPPLAQQVLQDIGWGATPAELERWSSPPLTTSPGLIALRRPVRYCGDSTYDSGASGDDTAAWWNQA